MTKRNKITFLIAEALLAVLAVVPEDQVYWHEI